MSKRTDLLCDSNGKSGSTLQTPAHLAVSLLIWRKAANWKETLAVVAGAIIPDASMFVFYGYQKLIGSAESDIWGSYYFLDHWQWFFDIFNSIPVFIVLAAVAFYKKQRVLFLIFASALVHVLCDLPLHNDDAHRHFLPLSNWRFISPVSYWDPKHFGVYAASVELIVAVASCIYLSLGKFKRSIRVSAMINLSLYLAAILAVTAYLLFAR